MDLIIALLLLSGLYLYCRLAIGSGTVNLVYYAIEITLLCAVGVLANNEWIARTGHLSFPVLLLAVALRLKYLRGRFSGLAFLVLAYFTFYLISSLWSEFPRQFFPLKFKVFRLQVLFFLAGLTIISRSDVEKLIKSLLPIAVLALCLLIAGRIDVDINSARVMVNEVNSNGIGTIAGASALLFLSALLCLKLRIVLKIFMIGCVLSSVYYLVHSGSRAAFAATGGGALIIGLMTITNMRHLFTRGLPALLATAISGVYIFLHSGVELVERLKDYSHFSGREKIWEKGMEIMRGMEWCGTGGFVQGSFITRVGNEYGDINLGSMLNIYVQTYFEMGYIGVFIGFLCILLFLKKFTYYFKDGGIDKIKFFVVGMSVVGFLHGVGEDSLRASSFISIIWILGMGMAAAGWRSNDSRDVNWRTSRKILINGRLS